MRHRGWGTGIALLLSVSCATNPATGRRQLMLVSESQEADMGKEADAQFHGVYGDFPDPKVQAYVERVARPLAEISERPALAWTFRVVDDPTVNAFALPGGYVYVTRGILTHLNSEAELAAVLGHEIGHVTGRHSASQMSKQMAGVGGLLLGSVFSSRVRSAGGALQSGLAVMFLKFGRDQETEADDLGLRYMVRKDYNPREMLDVFWMLDAVTHASGGGNRLPNWLSTHPAPENRIFTIRKSITDQQAQGSRVDREGYLAMLDGMVFGENPREGFFRDAAFLHPDLAFRVAFPRGWKTQNEKDAVTGVSPEQDAVVRLTTVDGDPTSAAAAFLRRDGVRGGDIRRENMRGLPAASMEFTARDGETDLRGLVTFVRLGERTFQLLGYSTLNRFESARSAIADWAGSFDRLTDERALAVQPWRIRLERIGAASTAAELQRRWNSPATPEAIAVINGVALTERLPANSVVKRIVGERWR